MKAKHDRIDKYSRDQDEDDDNVNKDDGNRETKIPDLSANGDTSAIDVAEDDKNVKCARSNLYTSYTCVNEKFNGSINHNMPLLFSSFEGKCAAHGLA